MHVSHMSRLILLLHTAMQHMYCLDGLEHNPETGIQRDNRIGNYAFVRQVMQLLQFELWLF
jgi:hypothetical protein